MSLPAGARLGPYEILGKLSEGGMGQVYRARDPRLDRHVAIKVLPLDVAADVDRVRRFEQEARAIGQLSHPNVLAIYDVGRIPDGLPGAGAPFLVTELLDGRTLRDEIAGPPLPFRRALDWAREIAEGLAAAHDKGIVHRDLKPENLFVTRDGHIKILDFGLAKARTAAADDAATALGPAATEAGVVMGTTGYMSPEQVRGQPIDQRSDLFAFGCVLYEMLAGRRAFRGDTTADTLAAILNAEPPPLTVAGDTTPAFERIVRRCLEKSPDRRFQSARDLAFSLESLPGSSTSVSAVPARRSRPRVVAAVAAAIVVLGLVGWMVIPRWLRSQADSPLDGARDKQPSAPPSVAPFMVGEAVEASPAWSPTSNLIAYVSDAAGNDDVWMVDQSGANAINLTKDHAGQDSFPAWSPDGRRIAFFSDRDGGGVYTMTPFGADVQKIVAIKPSVVYTFSLQWAQNGSLVFTNFDDAGDKQVYLVAAGGAAPECLTCGRTKVAGARYGDLSPSGRLLAYVGQVVGTRPPLYVMELASGVVHEITDRTDAPHWQRDDRLLFLSSRDGLPDVWEVGIDSRTGAKTSEPARLTSGLDATGFAVSGDGRQMLAVKEKSTSTIWSFPTSLAHVDSTSAGVALTSGAFRDGRPRWSADGREAFFESNRRGSLDVWKVAVSGGALTRLLSDTRAEQRPRPSPDGKWLAYDLDGNWVWVARPDGSSAHEAAAWRSTYSTACCADWSHTGLRLALSLTRLDGEGRLGVADVDPATGIAGNIREWNFPGALEEYPRWSPDDEWLAYEAFTNGSWDLWIVDARGGAPKRLTNFPGNERQAVWQSRPLMLYFLELGAVWRMPMSDVHTPSGPATKWLSIRGLRAIADGLDITRDGTRLVLSLAKPESDLWMVERK